MIATLATTLALILGTSMAATATTATTAMTTTMAMTAAPLGRRPCRHIAAVTFNVRS